MSDRAGEREAKLSATYAYMHKIMHKYEDQTLDLTFNARSGQGLMSYKLDCGNSMSGQSTCKLSAFPANLR